MREYNIEYPIEYTTPFRLLNIIFKISDIIFLSNKNFSIKRSSRKLNNKK